jgi:hypothetical protein
MEQRLAKILDECLARMKEGTTIDVCMAEHADVRKELEPLLYASAYIAGMDGVKASDAFRRESRGRLMARIQEEGIPETALIWEQEPTLLDRLSEGIRLGEEDCRSRNAGCGDHDGNLFRRFKPYGTLHECCFRCYPEYTQWYR